MLPLITWPTMHPSSCDIVVHFVKLSTAVQCWLKVKLIEKLKLLHSLNSAQPWLRTNSQYLAKSKQNVHKYNQKYFYYLPNKLSFLSQNEFERIIFNEVILARFSSVPLKNSAKIFPNFSKKSLRWFIILFILSKIGHTMLTSWDGEKPNQTLWSKKQFGFASHCQSFPNISHIWNYIE